MQGRGGNDAGRSPVVYCLVPRDLAAKLHEPLRRHFRDETSVEVVVERRTRERRSERDRRLREQPRGRDRRQIRGAGGRRAGERRASLVEVAPLPLPRRLQRHAARVVFVEQLEPGDLHAEDLDTARLVTAVQAGDREAFAGLYMRYFDRVFNYLRVALGERHAAEDSTQQVFTKVLEALPRYELRPGHVFRAWLFTIVRREALKELAKRHRTEPMDPVALRNRRQAEDPGELDVSVLDWVSDKDLVVLIARLPLPQRQVLMLRYMLDLDSARIGAILSRSPEDVRILQHRALRFLQERLTALGRRPSSGRRAPMGRWRKQYGVLRARRFALDP